MGCVPKTDKEKFNEKFKGKSIATDEMEKIDELFPENKIKYNEIDDQNVVSLRYGDRLIKQRIKKNLLKNRVTKKIYIRLSTFLLKFIVGEEHLLLGNLLRIPMTDVYYVRTSWGCSQACSYCSIRKATGKFHSKPFEICLDEFKKGIDQGYKKIYLPADDTGAYGKDIGRTFPELLEAFTKFEGDHKISIYAFNAVWLVKYVEELEKIVKSGKISGITIPVQSGNSRILKMMCRYHNTEKMKDAFIRIKKANPNVILCSHIITGFPTETKEEFQESLKFIIDAKIDIGVIMLMSIKSGTPAAEIEPKVTKEEIKKREIEAQKFLRKHGYRTKTGDIGLTFGVKN
jgi:tRNA A37 methylthiotransferase MiaB